jgi:hypothetical protein
MARLRSGTSPKSLLLPMDLAARHARRSPSAFVSNKFVLVAVKRAEIGLANAADHENNGRHSSAPSITPRAPLWRIS